MIRIRPVALLLGLALSTAACTDDLLTTVPTDRISDDTFWKTHNDFVLATNAAYRNVIGLDQMYFDGVTDIAYSQQYWMRNGVIARGAHDATYGWTNDLWNGLYSGIAKANEILAQLEATTALTPDQKRQIEGQARFLRGYFYHELLWMYGGVPLLTKVPSVEEARAATRATREQVFDLVMADLTAAAEMLPNTWNSANRGRATKGAALAFKTRAALYEASWRKYHNSNAGTSQQIFRTAVDAAQAVIGLGVYQLYPNFRQLFMYPGENSSEVIFAYQIVAGSNGWWAWLGFAPASMGGNVDLTPTRALVDNFLMKDGLPASQSPLYDNAIDKMYDNRDPRMYGTLLYPGAEFNGTIYNSLPNSPTSDRLDRGNFYNTHTGYVGLKYVDPADRAQPSNSGLDMIRMRYADVLLMKAEAHIELGEMAQAVPLINQVRARVGMPAVTVGSQAEMTAVIRRERVSELAWEGLRLPDIRRWRIAHEVMPGRVRGIDYMDGAQRVTALGDDARLFNAARDYLFPIPARERELNPNLVQNPGF